MGLDLKARVIVPVMTLAAAAMLAACGGGKVTPIPVPTSAPAGAPAAASPASVQSLQTLESVVAQCGTSPNNEVLISVSGKEPLNVPVGNWMNAYSQRIAGVGLPRSGFECVSAVYDPTRQLVFTYGQDKSALFPAELTVIDPKTGKEVGHIMHPGHIKGVVLGKLDTTSGSKEIVVVTAVSNIGSLVQQASRVTGRAQQYVPVAMAVDLKTMEVRSYLPLGNEGQPLFPTALLQNGSVTISYTLNVDGNNTPAAFAVSQLVTPFPMKLAAELNQAGAFR